MLQDAGLHRRVSRIHRMGQFQVRPPGRQRVQATPGAPGQVTAQVGFGVLAGGALDAGQVSRHGQPRLAGERLSRNGGRTSQRDGGCPALTLQRPAITMKLTGRTWRRERTSPTTLWRHQRRHSRLVP